MQIRLLGPVEVYVGAAPLDAGTARQRCVLAALAVDAGRPVPVDTLVDRVWGEAPPTRARETIHVYIARIRKMLVRAGTGAVVRRSAGYVLDVDPDAVDILLFRSLTTGARAPDGPPGTRLTLLRRAVDLWRGEPLADLSGDWPRDLRQYWRQEHLETLGHWAAAEIDAGNPGAPIRQLTAVVDRYPLAESLLAALLRALQAAGRGAEALDRYERTRKRLAEELGTDPSPALQEVHRSLLRGTGGGPGTGKAPAQLPLDVPTFTGRRALLDTLDALIADPARTAVVATLSGTAGVGKTALSVHWAHRVRHRFPDGQLFVNLRGFGPSGAALDPAEVLEGFLTALGVPAGRIPTDLAGRSAAYRSLLADRRVLVVVDNARDADQARPLLPGTPGCLAVVTSRHQLTSLVAIEGARPLALGLLGPAEARAMLARRLGPEWVTAEAGAVSELSAACAGLPIALAIVAAQADGRPDLPLRALAGQLTDDASRLDLLDGGDPSSNVRTVFSWSLRALSGPAERLLRRLGLHPGPAATVAAAAALAGSEKREAAALLAELARANLLTEHAPGRFGMHDLLHAYAADLAGADGGTDDPGNRAALHRLLDHYLHSATHAAQVLHPHMAPIAPAPPQPGTPVVTPAGPDAARAWFEAEDAVLVGLIHLAYRTGFDAHVWQLTRSRAVFATRQGRWSGHVALQEVALAAARRAGDRAAEAVVSASLGRGHLWHGDVDEGHRYLQRALEIYESLDDRVGQARAEHLLTEFFDHRQDHRTAVAHAYRALELYESVGDEAGTARALNAMGWCHTRLGEYATAVEHCERALTLFQSVNDPDGEAATRGSLGHAYVGLGRFTDAIGQFTRSIDLCRQVGERFYEADTLRQLGDAYRSAGDVAAARSAWRRALAIVTDLGHPMADEIRILLSGTAAGR